MSNLTTTASRKHLTETLKKAKKDNASIWIYYAYFNDYTCVDYPGDIQNVSIEGDYLLVPITTPNGLELYVRRFNIEGTYIAIQRRTQRTLVDTKYILSDIISDVVKHPHGEQFKADVIEHAFRRTTEEMNALYTFNDPCTATFLPANKPLLFLEDGTKYTRGFQQVKIGKAVRSICNDVLNMALNDKQVETITNKLKSKYAPIEILKSSSISEVYALNHAGRSECGTLADSCMRNKSYLYTDLDNSENCEILYAVNCEGELIGRALLWKTSCGKMVMDRIYSTDAHIEKFKAYAVQQGYYHKVRQSYDDRSDFINPNTGEKEVLWLDVVIKEMDLDNCPFMDTFSYYCNNDGVYYLSNDSNSDTTHRLREVDGVATIW